MGRIICAWSLLAILFTSCAGPDRVEEASGRTPDQDEVLQVAKRFLQCIRDHDAEAARELALANGSFVSVRGKPGARELAGFSHIRWFEMLERETRDVAEVFVGEPVVLVEGDVAVVWGAYEFFLEDELSHRGTNAINLVRTDGGWQVAGGAYSMEFPDR